MRRHLHEAVNGDTMVRGGEPKQIQEYFMVRCIGEDRAAVVATLDHMNADVWNPNPRTPCHAIPGAIIGLMCD